ncbi:hypothetical protein [Falsiroseomonas tokyonensis]|uniref:Uncharacterized protein n=1 Tax=Falsiroseomonas tokyonensis TaxID=430521 RepID=A0ABV7C315_9PROT|nr:hypothetical protein [Falsiroseomonas tokyonensis]MBU8540852.1 hypothetical protein [Falsiroseomonas tokyonensis]
MPWTDILPQRGVRISAAPGVTVSWRVKTKGTPIMAVTIGAELATSLGWAAKQRVRVRMDRAAGLLRFDRTDDLARSFALHGTKTTPVVAVNFSPPNMGVDGQQKATPVQHRVEDGGLTVELPGWARPAAAPVPAPKTAPITERVTGKTLVKSAPAVQPDSPLAALPPDDAEEARQMMRNGKVGARDLAEYFGWPQEQSIKVAAAIRDEMAARARGTAA